MNRKLMPVAVTALLAALLPPGLALAQARNGNVWDGRHHEPEAGTVRANERAAGIAPSQQQQTEQNQTLDQIGRQLTEKAQRDAATAPPPPRPPNPSGR
jgi:hypothetical protein